MSAWLQYACTTTSECLPRISCTLSCLLSRLGSGASTAAALSFGRARSRSARHGSRCSLSTLPSVRGAIAGRLERLPASRAGGVHRWMRWHGLTDGPMSQRLSLLGWCRSSGIRFLRRLRQKSSTRYTSLSLFPSGNALSPEGGGGYGETPPFFWGALLHLLRDACGLDELEP